MPVLSRQMRQGLSCCKSRFVLVYINKGDWKTSFHYLTRLTCMVFSQFFSLLMPALLITMSRRPNVSTVVWNASVHQKQKVISDRLQILAQDLTQQELNHFLACSTITFSTTVSHLLWLSDGIIHVQVSFTQLQRAEPLLQLILQTRWRIDVRSI